MSILKYTVLYEYVLFCFVLRFFISILLCCFRFMIFLLIFLVFQVELRADLSTTLFRLLDATERQCLVLRYGLEDGVPRSATDTARVMNYRHPESVRTEQGGWKGLAPLVRLKDVCVGFVVMHVFFVSWRGTNLFS